MNTLHTRLYMKSLYHFLKKYWIWFNLYSSSGHKFVNSWLSSTNLKKQLSLALGRARHWRVRFVAIGNSKRNSKLRISSSRAGSAARHALAISRRWIKISFILGLTDGALLKRPLLHCQSTPSMQIARTSWITRFCKSTADKYRPTHREWTMRCVHRIRVARRAASAKARATLPTSRTVLRYLGLFKPFFVNVGFREVPVSNPAGGEHPVLMNCVLFSMNGAWQRKMMRARVPE